MAGIFGFGSQPQPQPQPQGQGGILGYGQQPQVDPNIGILFAGLKDAGAYFSGHPADANNYAQQMVLNRQNAQYQAQLAAKQGVLSAGNDPAAMRAALTQVALTGGDPSSLIEAQNYGKPRLEAHPKTDNLFSVDPIKGTSTLIQAGQTTPPPGYQWNGDGSALQPITGGPAGAPQLPRGFQWADPGHTKMLPVPGFVTGAGEVSAARRAPKTLSTNGAIAIPHPSAGW